MRAELRLTPADAADGFELRKALIPVIEYLSGAPLPKVRRL